MAIFQSISVTDQLLLLISSSLLVICSTSAQQNSDVIVHDVQRSINESRRNLGYLSCGTGNPIDDCWRCDPDWERNRQRLAECSIGFGRNALGGRNGRYYVVSDSSDNDPRNPKPGTLRHAVTRDEPLWIFFKRDMVIRLRQALHVSSYKTIDGRGASVHIADGPCIKIRFATNIIVHGIHIHNCEKTEGSDGDGISIMASRHIWVDHCSLSKCYDGLIDVTHASTAVTISNNYMTHHDKVMLLGHSDSFTQDRHMQVTIAFNHFGEGLVQRMPRCRFGYFHVVNNDYTHWELYAIGGSSNPTINSQGNRFLAAHDNKEVTKHFYASENEWRQWNWRSDGDLMLNGAYFRESGAAGASIGTFARASSLSARPSTLVGSMTHSAGALSCRRGSTC